MKTLSLDELRTVTGGVEQKIGPILGTKIVHVPPKENVCNEDQYKWMLERVGKGVQYHVVAADAALCGYAMPKYTPSMGTP